MMKTNKSPRVDGITPKLLKEIVNEISTPHANVFNISLNPFYPEATADELQPVPDHFLKSICQHLKMTGLHLKWT